MVEPNKSVQGEKPGDVAVSWMLEERGLAPPEPAGIYRSHPSSIQAPRGPEIKADTLPSVPPTPPLVFTTGVIKTSHSVSIRLLQQGSSESGPPRQHHLLFFLPPKEEEKEKIINTPHPKESASPLQARQYCEESCAVSGQKNKQKTKPKI